jgi:hypothetical protein
MDCADMFSATLAIAVACVLATSVAPLYAARVPLRRSVRLGSSLVLAAAGIVCCCAAAPSGTVPLRGPLSLTAFPLFLAGSLLLLERGDDSDDEGADEGPWWWPEFEAGFRRYAARPRHPVAGR